jgi:hypothetical protein
MHAQLLGEIIRPLPIVPSFLFLILHQREDLNQVRCIVIAHRWYIVIVMCGRPPPIPMLIAIQLLQPIQMVDLLLHLTRQHNVQAVLPPESIVHFD